MAKPEDINFTSSHIQNLKYEIEHFIKVASIDDENVKKEMK